MLDIIEKIKILNTKDQLAIAEGIFSSINMRGETELSEKEFEEIVQMDKKYDLDGLATDLDRILLKI